MRIETQEQAQATIEALEVWLEEHPELDDLTVRDWCYHLLYAADADGQGGCLLCQG